MAETNVFKILSEFRVRIKLRKEKFGTIPVCLSFLFSFTFSLSLVSVLSLSLVLSSASVLSLFYLKLIRIKNSWEFLTEGVQLGK